MRVAVLKEDPAIEPRVAATPETVKKLIALGATVAVEAGAGAAAGLSDQRYREAGAEIAANVPTRRSPTPTWCSKFAGRPISPATSAARRSSR